MSEKFSDNERLKKESNLLRGTIKDDLSNNLTGGFLGDNFQLIRFHGMYQQDDRDIRAERTAQMLEPLHTVMLRVRLPGGIITPHQWQGIDAFASEHTNYGSIRITNRQALQLHGVLKQNIKPVHQLLHHLGLDSRATAGDVNRNVLCTSNPVESGIHQQAYEWAKRISEHLLPKTNAYAEVWLDGEKIKRPEDETILGNSYLPRKFKTAVVIPPQNDVDLHANDLSFVAISDGDKLTGFNILVGGGLAMTQGDQSTYPRLASELGYITPDAALSVAAAVVTTQRDWGNRTNRRNAKTKYTIDRVGVDVFRAEVERRAGIKFCETRPYLFTERGDRIGWVEGVDGNYHLTLFIPSGRLIDKPGRPIKTGLAKIAQVHNGDFRLTPNQNIIIAGVSPDKKEEIDNLAQFYGLIDQSLSMQRKNSMACVSYPTCPLAMAEAERILPQCIDHLEEILFSNGISHDSIIFRVTGCPNGCGRAMLAEIGLVGRALGRYDLYIGGNKEGTRIPRMYRQNLAIDSIFDELSELITNWAKNRIAEERFGDFAVRTGIIRPVLNSTIDFYQV
ncbi:TPA: assimilatory sulfite reductase (NADPH) hemoprotein subunit [Escherichia coli]|uniref:Sulfite reductase [NADPH] hemoprotein beta-component n=3 Tax=Klebsiella pneumoniae complex TaxID=3390273 RepID=A0A9P0Y6R6_KLEVA|nr:MULTISPECIES: assimilatory sulfite reductase (NADPH) hemoprotein subunit [Enterobacteriaceae]MRL38330.1 assimilatory sulfite reductase (NADPH) hemoprotein subunit [Klebsiella pneumoniae]HDZ9396240.1 assimilatory sulfite reductase (NADPH) hemoprotein subunit [Klebsiella variicola subsp. variicola]MBX4609756.1 sulfite reductase subunit beta [Klebsiella variicola]MCJ8628636.1 assimilatory sulfite reductase (NADPH) hemoprotein subunit [Escherichia coli]NWO62972.1 assimilatory sulfite reductase 